MGVLRACFAAVVIAACTKTGPAAAPTPPTPPPVEPLVFETEDVETILRSDDELATWLSDPERLRLQVLVAVPNAAGSLDRSAFRADRDYFYPASAVKLCAAFGALEKLGELAEEHGEGVSPASSLRIVTGQGRTRRSVSTTIGKDIEQALVVSDNDAFNRLLDFVGPEELAERLARRGITSARVANHLGEGAASSSAPTIELLLPDGAAIPIGQRIGFPIPAAPSVALGRAYRNERGRLVRRPMNFETKNAMPLRELQDLLVGIMRPELEPDPAAWDIPFRSFLVDTLGARPGGALDARYKPLAVAIESALPDQGIRVYGKGGRAYGFAVENAYVTSEATGRSFFLGATIYANGNDVMNDDRYEYDAVANPFIARLGVVLAQHLLLPKSATRSLDRHDEDR